MEINRTYYEDGLITIARMPSLFVDVTITSPPYDKQRTYNGYSFEFEKIADGIFRVTKEGGVLVWIVADAVENGGETGTSFRQALYFISTGFRLHDTMIYQKRNFSHPEKTRYHSVFEYMFVFSKGKPKTFNPIIDRKNITAGEIGNRGINTFTQRDGSKSVRKKSVTKDFGRRHNVWLGNTRGQEEACKKLKHPAMMPKWVARDHIISWSNPGDLVFDPLAGSGTVGQMAKELNRNFVMAESNIEYEH